MPSDFKDHFSDHSEKYDQFRPDYPDELFYHLAYVTPQHNRAWDCATGTGQAAVVLAKYFQQVIATDASENQINQAQHRKNIHYHTAPAEHSAIEARSIDLVTIAQALHWFDLDAFAIEVDRILVDQGVLAVWTYNLLTINPQIDEIVNHLYMDLLDSYWPPERKLVASNYQGIQFPFEEMEVPQFEMHSHWNLHQLVGYLNTWSATKRYQTDQDQNPVELIYNDLAASWGNTEQEHPVRWPLTLRLWRKS